MQGCDIEAITTKHYLSAWLAVYMYLISDRETAVKFNDYFEFPRELDMSPYTAAKLAKIEGTYLYAWTIVHTIHWYSKELCLAPW